MQSCFQFYFWCFRASSYPLTCTWSAHSNIYVISTKKRGRRVSHPCITYFLGNQKVRKGSSMSVLSDPYFPVVCLLQRYFIVCESHYKLLDQLTNISRPCFDQGAFRCFLTRAHTLYSQAKYTIWKYKCLLFRQRWSLNQEVVTLNILFL